MNQNLAFESVAHLQHHSNERLFGLHGTCGSLSLHVVCLQAWLSFFMSLMLPNVLMCGIYILH